MQHRNLVQLTNKIVSAGKVKNNGQAYIPAEDYLTIELFEHGHLASTQIMEHPLSKRIEYEEKNQLITKPLALDKAEFFVRLNLTNDHPEIKISETLKNSTKKELASFEL